MKNTNTIIPYSIVIMVVFLWASASVAGKLLGSDMRAADISIWRTVFGILTILLLMKRDSRGLQGMDESRSIRIADYVPLWIIGIAGYGLMQWLFFLSAQRTYASHLVLIMSLTPLFVKFLRFALYREAVTMRVWAGSALAIGGAAVVLMPGKLSGDIILGDMLAAGAMVAFAIYTEGVNAYGRKQSSAAANLHVMGAGLLFLLIVAGWPQHQEESFSFRLDLPNVGELGGLLYLGICTTGIAYWGYTWSIRKLSAAVVTPFLYLQPAFGVLLAWIILEEHVKGWFLLGVFFILAGLHVVQRRTAER